MTQQIVILQALSTMPRELADCLAGADAADCLWKPGTDDWSILEIVSHLIYVEEKSLARLELLLTEEQPCVSSIPAELIPLDAQLTHVNLLHKFRQARSTTLSFLKNLTPEEWQRRASHETRGVIDLQFLVQYLVEHDRQHLQQINDLLQRRVEQ